MDRMRDRSAASPGTHRHRVHEALDRARRGAPPTGGDVAARWLSGVAAFADRDGAWVLALARYRERRWVAATPAAAQLDGVVAAVSASDESVAILPDVHT
jgi:hypothetical protein